MDLTKDMSLIKANGKIDTRQVVARFRGFSTNCMMPDSLSESENRE
jgi:hypothetical protein